MLKNFSKSVLFLCLFFLLVSIFSKVKAAVVINEFSSASPTEWVELFNTDANNPVNLTGYSITETTGGTAPLSLSGTLPRHGMLTFSFPTGSLPDAGGILILKDASGATIHSVSYGNQNPGGSIPHVDAPSATQSANAKESGGANSYDWSVGTPNKGWCDISFPQCISVADIVSRINSEGVNTNLGDQEDMSRITGLYFERTDYGKISFASEINFTDKDAMSWLSNLDAKLDLRNRGTIGLDADAVKAIINTRATLTMYNITFNNPTIKVYNTDGTPGESSIISNLTYNKSAHTLTFTAAHFTTFKVVETSSSSSSSPSPSSSSSSNPPRCSAEAPDHAPHLFQIDTTKENATLYFTPVNNAVSYYFIAYGFKPGDERFGVSFPQGYYDGVLSYTINCLSPNTTYYFKVRAGHDCAPGDWSNTLAATTKNKRKTINSTTEKTILKKSSPTPTLSPFPTTSKQNYKNRKKISPSPSTKHSSHSSKKTSFLQKIINFLLGKK